MKLATKIIAAAALSAAVISGTAYAEKITSITGAGATFPYPVYAKWAQAYQTKTGVKLNYQSIGSGGGIQQIKAKTVDFGASDKPLSPDDLKASGLMQFPTVMGGVVPVVNIPGIQPGQLKLSGQVLANIFLGNIKNWNDPAIAALNPGVSLPNKNITVVHRSDGSGTTFLFTNYLKKVSPDWSSKVGNDASVQWPVGIGGKGNEGVAAYVQQVPGAIGYVEFAYAVQNKLSHTLLQNHDGKFVAPSMDNFKSAAASADWKNTPNFAVILTDQAGDKSWPITGATFILMQTAQDKPDHAKAVLSFFDWAYKHGDKMAADLDYIPMPDSVVKLINDAWKTQIKDNSGKAVWG